MKWRPGNLSKTVSAGVWYVGFRAQGLGFWPTVCCAPYSLQVVNMFCFKSKCIERRL